MTTGHAVPRRSHGGNHILVLITLSLGQKDTITDLLTRHVLLDIPSILQVVLRLRSRRWMMIRVTLCLAIDRPRQHYVGSTLLLSFAVCSLH